MSVANGVYTFSAKNVAVVLLITQKCEIINLYSQRVLYHSLKHGFHRKSSTSALRTDANELDSILVLNV